MNPAVEAYEQLLARYEDYQDASEAREALAATTRARLVAQVREQADEIARLQTRLSLFEPVTIDDAMDDADGTAVHLEGEWVTVSRTAPLELYHKAEQ